MFSRRWIVAAGLVAGLLTVAVFVNARLSWQPVSVNFGASSVGEPHYLPIAWRGNQLWLLQGTEGLAPGKTLPKTWRVAQSWGRNPLPIVQTAINDDDVVALSPADATFARSGYEDFRATGLDLADTTGDVVIWRDHRIQQRLEEPAYRTPFDIMRAKRHTVFSFSPDGKRLISDSELFSDKESGQVPAGFCTYGAALFDTSNGQMVARYSALEGCFTDFAWSPNSREVAGITADGWVFVLDASTGRLRLKFRAHRLFGAQIAWAPDGKTILTATNPRAGWSPTHLGYDLKSGVSFMIEGEGQMTSDEGNAPLSVITDANGDTTWNGRTERLLKRFDARTGKLVGAPIPLETGAVDMAFSPDGRQLALGEHGFVLILNADTLATERRLTLPPTPASKIALPVCVAWSPDGATLSTSRQTGLTLWRTR